MIALETIGVRRSMRARFHTDYHHLKFTTFSVFMQRADTASELSNRFLAQFKALIRCAHARVVSGATWKAEHYRLIAKSR